MDEAGAESYAGQVPGREVELPARGGAWSRPIFTAHLRGFEPGLLALQRDQELRIHESSLAYRVARLFGRVPKLGPAASLEERTRALEVARASRLYGFVEGLRGGRAYRALWAGGLRRVLRPGRPRRTAPVPAGAAEAPGAAPPQLDPNLSARIDAAIEVLRLAPFEELQRRGWHFQPRHFYWPLNDVEFLAANRELWHDRGVPRAIEWDLDGQLELARTAHRYFPELADVPEHPPSEKVEFAWANNAFGGADAVVYYGLVREHRPARVVEVGCGWSSLVLARAIAENGGGTEVVQVEPYPNEELFAALPRDWQHHRVAIQHAGLELFDALEPGDICFYDGSHCVSTASDVVWFFFEVLPRLKPGVWVHVHDLFFPDDYHDNWVFDEGLSWNEQYLVQAFLMHNDAYRVRIANHMLWRERREQIRALYDADGGSVWLEKARTASR